jgi:hypothetical protein
MAANLSKCIRARIGGVVVERAIAIPNDDNPMIA